MPTCVSRSREHDTSTAMAAPHFLNKTDLRRAMLAGRVAAADAGAAAGEGLVGHALALIGAGEVVAGTWPLGTEIDVRPLLLALIGRGQEVVLPETPARGEALRFRRWRPGVAMVEGRYRTVFPDGPLATPTLLLVPLLAFDLGCRRLGYGGGYYDRTIAGLPGIRTIGCGYASQQVDEVPVLPHDAPLDAVATERGVVLRPES